MSFNTGGAFPASLTPSPTKTLFNGNYFLKNGICRDSYGF